MSGEHHRSHIACRALRRGIARNESRRPIAAPHTGGIPASARQHAPLRYRAQICRPAWSPAELDSARATLIETFRSTGSGTSPTWVPATWLSHPSPHAGRKSDLACTFVDQAPLLERL